MAARVIEKDKKKLSLYKTRNCNKSQPLEECYFNFLFTVFHCFVLFEILLQMNSIKVSIRVMNGTRNNIEVKTE